MFDKNEFVMGVEEKTKSLVLPFTIVGNATPASVVVSIPDAALFAIKTEGTDGIALLKESGETVTISNSSISDANSIFGMYVKVEPGVVGRVCAAHVTVMLPAANGAVKACVYEGTAGITDKGNILLSVDLSGPALNAGNTLVGALHVDYVLA